MTESNQKLGFYKNTDAYEAMLHRIITLRLRSMLATYAYYLKGSENGGLFDIVDPSEEASMMMNDLVAFGFIDRDLVKIADPS